MARFRLSRGAAALSALMVATCLVAPQLASSTASATSTTKAISAARCAANKAAGPITYVSPYAFDASAGIIDIFAAQSLGYFTQMCLTVNFVTNSYVPTELVSAGRGTITGIGSAADALTEMANSAHVVSIATYGDTSDYALLTSPSIKQLSDLEGKTLGYKTTVPVVLTEMLQKAGVSLSKVKEVSVGFDPNILPEGKVQALQAYRTNEPLTLSAEHKAYREWVPSSFGVAGTFNVQVVNATFLAKHRGATEDFLRAELKGFSYCAANKVACVKIEQKASLAAKVPFDYAHSLAEWTLESSLAIKNTLAGRGVGVQSLAEWKPEEKALVAAKLIKMTPALGAVEDTDMVSSLYNGKTLIWPGA